MLDPWRCGLTRLDIELNEPSLCLQRFTVGRHKGGPPKLKFQA